MKIYIVVGVVLGGMIANSVASPPEPARLMSDKNIQKVHTCHDKGKLVAITRDVKGEYVTCNKSWAEWKKYIKKLKKKP